MGYVDRPGSAYILRVLELIGLPIEKITREALRQGPFIQLTDRELFTDLAPNERTGLFEPNSDANDRYRVRSGDRVAFAYANFARQPGRANAAIARIEVPGWIASDPRSLDWLRPPSTPTASRPAILTFSPAPMSWRSSAARREEGLEQMLFQVMLRNGLMPEISFKATNKLLTGGGRR